MPEQKRAREIFVGLVGHRRERLPSLGTAALGERLRREFKTLEAGWGERPVVLVTGMADGTDLIGAASRPAEWRLCAIMTEPPAALARRMTADDAANLLQLLAQPNATAEVLTGPPDGYLGQAATILSRVDLLVAVMDGRSGGGPGGTADSVAKASELGLPVLLVPPAGGPGRWLQKGPVQRTPASRSALPGEGAETRRRGDCFGRG